jgi:uncharacterized phage-associated protein
MFKSSFYKTQRDKIGNIIVHISNEVPEKGKVSLTKMVKLLFLIDESSVLKTGVPITWLDHYAWKRGPVADDVYFEIKRLEHKEVKDTELSLDEFIEVYEDMYQGSSFTAIKAKKTFNKEIFTSYEVTVIDEILRKYRDWSAKELEDETHKEGTPYDLVVKANKLQQVFEIKGKSNIPIDFINLIQDSPFKKLAYKNAYDSLSFESDIC